MRTRSAGGVVTNAAGEVLVVSQRGTSWSLPKGHIDAGEDALAAARREFGDRRNVSTFPSILETKRRLPTISCQTFWPPAFVGQQPAPGSIFQATYERFRTQRPAGVRTLTDCGNFLLRLASH